ncbi:MAG: hypothetical protein ACYDAC_00605 [Candidatus Dormibacteria bacterium]
MADLQPPGAGGAGSGDAADDEFVRQPGGWRLSLPGASRRPRHLRLLATAAAGLALAAGATAGLLSLRQASSPAALSHVALPGARRSAAMAFDSVGGVTVLYGGFDANGHNLYDTWLWSGSAWSPLPASGLQPQLVNPSMADDPADAGVILVGAAVAGHEIRCAPDAVSCTEPDYHGVAMTETWLLSAGAWREVSGLVVQPTVPLTLATVPSTSAVVAVASSDETNCSLPVCPLSPLICVSHPSGGPCLNSLRAASWYWSNRRWTAVAGQLVVTGGARLVPSPTGGSVELVSLAAPVQPLCINADGGCPSDSAVPRAWHWFMGGWVPDPATTALPPLEAGTVALDGSRALLVGTDQAWELADGTWVPLGGGLPFGRRLGLAVAADRNGAYVIFGGASAGGGAGNDTWLLTAGGWHLVGGSGPSAGAAVAPTSAAARPARCLTRATTPQYAC